MKFKEWLLGAPQKAFDLPAQEKGSTEGWLPVADIRNGVILLKDGRIVKILEVLPVLFDLKSDMEKENLIYYFASYLKIAPTHLQIRIVNRPADIRYYTKRMEDYEKDEPSETCRALIRDNIQEVDHLAQNEVLNIRIFLIFQLEPDMKLRGSTLEAAAERMYEEAQTARRYSITCLQFACLAYEAAPENVNSMRHLECSMDDTYEAAESALACYCDLISPHDYGDNSECFTYGCYYSSKHMMEFYRLCRVHAKLLRVKLHEEPFFARAKRFVYSQLGNAYTFDYTLQTKVNREYASGIAVRFTGDFYEFEDFNMAMIDVMRFYRDEAARLKNTLAMTRRTDSDMTIREEAA